MAFFASTLGFAKAQDGAGPQKPNHTILVLGDSLSAEYGLARGSGWVAIIQERLDRRDPPYRIHNASISGDTTSGGLSRLPDALAKQSPDIVIIELGSNDALRGLSLDMTEKNLAHMITQSKDAGAEVLLVGMQIPSNYGPTYTKRFKTLFHDLAKGHQVALTPFLLEGMATNRDLFQTDGIHPNEEAQPILADNIWAQLESLLTPAAGTPTQR